MTMCPFPCRIAEFPTFPPWCDWRHWDQDEHDIPGSQTPLKWMSWDLQIQFQMLLCSFPCRITKFQLFHGEATNEHEWRHEIVQGQIHEQRKLPKVVLSPNTTMRYRWNLCLGFTRRYQQAGRQAGRQAGSQIHKRQKLSKFVQGQIHEQRKLPKFVLSPTTTMRYRWNLSFGMQA